MENITKEMIIERLKMLCKMLTYILANSNPNSESQKPDSNNNDV